MGKSPGRSVVLEEALAAILHARTLEDLKMAQAAALPLLHGFSMEQTARIIGVSVSWASQLRKRFMESGITVNRYSASPIRRRASMSLDEERNFLAPFLDRMRAGENIPVRDVKQALDKCLQRTTAPATVYNLLIRHGWREIRIKNRTGRQNTRDRTGNSVDTAGPAGVNGS